MIHQSENTKSNECTVCSHPVPVTRPPEEMSLRHDLGRYCQLCREIGHIRKDCPHLQKTAPSRRSSVSASTVGVKAVSVSTNEKNSCTNTVIASETYTKAFGPPIKVKAMVEGVLFAL